MVKKWPTILIAITIVIAAGIFYYYQSKNREPVESALPFLRVEGKDIVTESGKQITLKGINFGSWLLWEGCALGILNCEDYPEYKLRAELESRIDKGKVDQFFNSFSENFIREDDFLRVKELGLNFVRLGFHYRYVQAYELTALDQAVQWAKENGIYVILNMHAAPGAQAPAYFADSDGNAYLWENEADQEQYFELWEVLAERYKNEPTIAGYEILNEPEAEDGTQVADLYQNTIERIRNIDGRHIAFLDGNHYASDFSIFKPPLTKNAVYVFHTYVSKLEELQQLVKEKEYLDFQKQYQTPIMCNEFDEYGFTNFFEKNDIHWAPWTYKSLNEAGPFYSASQDNVWRKWITGFHLDDTSKRNFRDSLLETIKNSPLPDSAKKELADNLGSLKRTAFELGNKFPDQYGELKKVADKYQELIKIKDKLWLDDFAESLNTMPDSEYQSLMESLRTEYWTNQENDSAIDQALLLENKTNLICRLMGQGKTQDNTGDIWEGDLGASFIYDSKLHLITGDTGSGANFAPNAMATTSDTNAADCLDLSWSTNEQGGPTPPFPLIEPDSTVPSGAISINGTIYVFMMDVTDWTHPAKARSLLVKSENGSQSFFQVWENEVDRKFVNIAPVIGNHPLEQNKQAVYLVASGQYRQSPVYLAYAELDEIENESAYHYFTGTSGGVAQWNENQAEAVPIINDVKVGELSVQWNRYLNQWLIAYFDYDKQPANLYFRSADNLWEAWSEEKLVFSGSERYDWYQSQTTRIGTQNPWGTPYGGYLLPDNYNDSRKTYFVLSLWNPYSIFLMEANLDSIF